MKREILGVVVCGGKSRRMGESKAMLEARPGVRQLDYALELLGLVCQRVGAAIGEEEALHPLLPESVESIADDPLAEGPLAGVLGALRVADGWPVLVLACDMPYLEPSVLVKLVNRRDPERCATAFMGPDGRPEPLCAIYEPSARGRLEEAVKQDRYSLRDWLVSGAAQVIALDRPDLLASVNDRSSLERARRDLSWPQDSGEA